MTASRLAVFAVVQLALAGCTRPGLRRPESGPASPAARAVAFLTAEVNAWRRDNGCYSCHNNGDAARALYTHVRRFGASGDPIADTTRWLRSADRWDDNGGGGPYSDKNLARLQFAAALVAADRCDLGGALESEDGGRRSALVRAADAVAESQGTSGAWQDAAAATGSIGSPITWGPNLATAMALDVLRHVGRERFRAQIDRAAAWLDRTPIVSVLDAAAALPAFGDRTDPVARARLRHALSLIRRGQSRDGGWGPFVRSPPEVFDTALVLVSLARLDPSDPVLGAAAAGEVDAEGRVDVGAMIARGRRFLFDAQQADGSWVETTRPPGHQSYAHWISTTGWALEALVVTEGR